ncbi:hypothetical protein J6590_106241, partial [Homalodisca vitripennis]
MVPLIDTTILTIPLGTQFRKAFAVVTIQLATTTTAVCMTVECRMSKATEIDFQINL